MSDKIEILDLLALASFKTLQNFDTSSIHYHLNDEDGLVEEVSQAFQKTIQGKLQRMLFNAEKINWRCNGTRPTSLPAI